MNDLAGPRRSLKPNGRILIASAVLILGLVLYAGLAVTVADWLPPHQAVQGLFIAAAGLIWVWPAVRLIRWASRRTG